MDQSTSAYQSLKIFLAEYAPVDRDILHVLIGLTVTIVAIALARGSLRFRPLWLALLVACTLGVVMEVLDMRDDLNSLDAWRWQESTLDFLRTIAVPLAALLLVFAIKRKRRQ